MILLSVMLGSLAFLIFVPVVILFFQVFMALFLFLPKPLSIDRRPSISILIPAHNEAAVIGATLDSIAPQLAKGDRMLVVADNCSDETAAIARKSDAEVVERTDHERRGKGYALDFGVRSMRDHPPEAVIIIDADCQVLQGTIDRLVRVCSETSRPVQALYLMRSPDVVGLKTRIAEFAWIVKNHVRPLGYHRLGLPCQLMGTGMAFPWNIISNAELASGHIVEDMKFGIDLALSGHSAVFCPDAKVISYFPSDKAAETTQRMRWEHGHLSVILKEFPRLLAGAFRRRDWKLFALAADLVMPPLSLLALIITAIFSLNLVIFLVADLVWPLYLSMITFSLFVSAIAIAWYGWGRRVITFLSLLMIPFYILSKIPLYLRFLTKRQSSWIKTGRD